MTKSGDILFKLVFISGVLLLAFFRCDKADPCDELSVMQRVIHCLIEQPADGEIVSPDNVELRWVSKAGTYKVYFGTDKNNLSLISTQTTMTHTLTNLEVNTKYYWKVDAQTTCLHCSTVTSSFTTGQ